MGKGGSWRLCGVCDSRCGAIVANCLALEMLCEDAGTGIGQQGYEEELIEEAVGHASNVSQDVLDARKLYNELYEKLYNALYVPEEEEEEFIPII